MDIDDLYVLVFFEFFPKFTDKYIHTSGVEDGEDSNAKFSEKMK